MKCKERRTGQSIEMGRSADTMVCPAGASARRTLLSTNALPSA